MVALISKWISRLSKFWWGDFFVFLVLAMLGFGISLLLPFQTQMGAYVLSVFFPTYVLNKFGFQHRILDENSQYLQAKIGVNNVIKAALVAASCMSLVLFFSLWLGKGALHLQTNFSLWSVIATAHFILINVCGIEYLFRGILFDSLQRKFGTMLTVFLSSLLFAWFESPSLQSSFIAFCNIFLLGCLLAYWKIYSSSLTFSISFHATWKIILTLFVDESLVRFTGADSISYIRFPVKSNLDLLVWGGENGFIEGLFVTILLFVFGASSFKLLRINPFTSSRILRNVFGIASADGTKHHSIH